MHYGVSDVRLLGFKKILSQYYHDEVSKQAFIRLMIDENSLLQGMNSSAFTLPLRYKDIHESLNSSYSGMVEFINLCCPLSEVLENPDISVQRKVRNQWNAIWGSVILAFEGTPWVEKNLKELGIRICYAEKVDKRVLDFYNKVLKWYVLTVSETAIEEAGFKAWDLIERMVLDGL